MPASADPYPVIRAVIERDLQHAQKLQTAAFAGRMVLPELASALASVEENLKALRDAVAAMVATPAKFGLQPLKAHQRQVEVEDLGFQLADLKRAADQLPVSKPAYREIELHRGDATSTKGSAPQTGQPDDDTEQLDQRVQQYMQEQDDVLQEISIRVEHVKQTGRLMHEELGEQERLLHDLTDGVDSQYLKLRGLRKRVQDILKRSKWDSQLLTIIILSVILVVLTVAALA